MHSFFPRLLLVFLFWMQTLAAVKNKKSKDSQHKLRMHMIANFQNGNYLLSKGLLRSPNFYYKNIVKLGEPAAQLNALTNMMQVYRRRQEWKKVDKTRKKAKKIANKLKTPEVLLLADAFVMQEKGETKKAYNCFVSVMIGFHNNGECETLAQEKINTIRPLLLKQIKKKPKPSELNPHLPRLDVYSDDESIFIDF